MSTRVFDAYLYDKPENELVEELKTYDFPVDHGDFTTTIELFYLKSDVDKVLAKLEEIQSQKMQLEDDVALLRRNNTELKKERAWLAKDRAQAYDDLEKRAQLNIKQEESIRHHKYKRCLAMAKWCESENYTACWYHENSERCEWTEKWHERWLELAEKFKPNNSTAQQGKG